MINATVKITRNSWRAMERIAHRMGIQPGQVLTRGLRLLLTLDPPSANSGQLLVQMPDG